MASHDAAASFAIGMARHVPRCICHQGYAISTFGCVCLLLRSSFSVNIEKEGSLSGNFAARHRSEMSRPEPRQVIDVVTILSRHLSISIGCYCERDDCCHSSILKSCSRLLIPRFHARSTRNVVQTRVRYFYQRGEVSEAMSIKAEEVKRDRACVGEFFPFLEGYGRERHHSVILGPYLDLRRDA